MSGKSSSPSQVISLPKGGGAQKGIGEKFSPDLFTGTGNFTIPIALPPGRNGFEPQLNLVYSSGNGNGAFGLGWASSIPGVSRKTSKGIPRYDDARDTFLLSGTEDLVPVPGGPIGATRYRPRTEGLFARIVHHRDNQNNYWKVCSKDGLVSLYGTPESAGTDAAVVADPSNRHKVFTWNLTRTIDPYGNRIEYNYERDQIQTEDSHHWDQLYLSEIRYIDHGDTDNPQFLVTVRFIYEERPDRFSEYRPGFEIRTVRRCTRIDVFTHADIDRLTRTYGFVYLDQQQFNSQELPLNRLSLLSQIRVTGHDNNLTEELPPLDFAYTQFQLEKRDFFPVTGPDLPPSSLAKPSYELVDLLGNGLPSVFEMNGKVRYWRNLGMGRLDLPREMPTAPGALQLPDTGVQLVDANGDGRTDLLVTNNDGLAGYFPLRFGAMWDDASFRRYRVAPGFNLEDPEVRLVDLDGDGVTDAIRSGTRLECFFNNSLEGWTDTRSVERQSLEQFPNINFSDPRVKWADITGDGLQDIVLVHDGNVEYWPNLGYGNWAPRVSMRSSPRFPFGYDPKRLLVGDVDGDGLADIVYIDDAQVTLWINQSGNSWSEPIVIQGTPPVSDLDAVRLVDMLGSGVSGVLWSTDASWVARERMFFLDFTGGSKPYLLCEMDNNFGAVTRISYAPSTRFYLEDEKRPETRWKTSLPFPVQLVARVEVIDAISGGKLTTEYTYHHGYWDGAEREFRGFGRVDQRDTEVFEKYNAAGLHGLNRSFEAVPNGTFSPPTETRTWFHQGPIGDDFGEWEESDFSAEFWSGDQQTLIRPPAIINFLKSLPRRVKRDALRTLRGSILRTELYALDDTERRHRPYTVTERLYGVREESPPGLDEDSRPRIFFASELAQRITQWERGHEPLTRLTFTEDYDQYGQPRSRISIAVPRGRDFRVAAASADPYLATHVLTTFAQRDDEQRYIVNREASATSYEILNDGSSSLFTLKEAILSGSAARRVIGQAVNFYDGAAFQGLSFGQIGDHGAPMRSERLVLTDSILHEAYKSGAAVQTPAEEPPYLTLNGPLPWTADYPQEFREQLPPLAGYVHQTGGNSPYETGYFSATERRSYDFQEFGGSGRGLIKIARDPLGRDTAITYDDFDLLPTAVVDPLGLTTRAEYDYRVLQPREVIDVNECHTRFVFTPIGSVNEVWTSGNPARNEGDRQRPSLKMTYDFMAFMNSPPEQRQPIVVQTLRQVHHDTETDVPLPDRDQTIQSIEYSDGFGRLLQTRTQAEDVAFGDLIFGDAGLLAAQSGPIGAAVGQVSGNDDSPRVVVSGWQTYDNKGRIVEQYEPFFSLGWNYDPPADEQLGQKTTMHYDPRGQVIRTVNPNGSEQSVVYGIPNNLSDPEQFTPTPWEFYTYDLNDNAGRTHLVESLSYQHHWDTPASAKIDALGRTVETVVRNRNAPDANNPFPVVEEQRTRHSYDLRGNLLVVIDAKNREAFDHVYDLANKLLRIESIDAGTIRKVIDAAGNIVEQRDGKGALALHAHDQLNRPLRLWARDETNGSLTLRELLEYGDGSNPAQPQFERAASRLAHRLGKLHRHYDEAGLLTFEEYDFKGNSSEKVRRVISDASILSVFTPPPAGWQVPAFRVDWQPPAGATLDQHVSALLDEREYRTSASCDALNRIKTAIYPRDVNGERKQLRPRYNRAGALESVELDSALYVERIAYNAKGQRVLVAYANGVMTRHVYDPQTFRLARLRTERFSHPPGAEFTYQPAAQGLQDFAYSYDLAGNIIEITDRVSNSGVLNNPEALLVSDADLVQLLVAGDAMIRHFEYDALYSLTSATGRECDTPLPPAPWDDAPKCQDVMLARAYTERFSYDRVGNMTQLAHQAVAGSGSFTRTFTLTDDNNRLASVSFGTSNFAYTYDASGNLIRETTSRHFEWDYGNRMRVYRTQPDGSEPSVHAHYLYDSGGQRVKKLVRKQGGQVEVTVYVDGIFEHHRIIQGGTTDENNTLHVMDNHSRIAMLRVGVEFADDPFPAVRFHLGDHLSSSNIVLDSSGSLINREEYTPFGETSFGSFARKRYRFTGKERDEESGFYYHGARYYAPWLGRWVSCDPMGRVDALNLFTYTRNNPARRTDPTGTQSEPLGNGGGGTEGGHPGGPLSEDSGSEVSPEIESIDPDEPNQSLPEPTASYPDVDSTPSDSDKQRKEKPTSNLGTNLMISGASGPVIRDVYVRAAKQFFDHDPKTREEAARMVVGRGSERIVTRGVSSGLSIYFGYTAAEPYLEQGEYGRAALEATPSAVSVGTSAFFFVRDKSKYGSFLGAMGNPKKKEELIGRMMAGERVAAQTSDVWTRRITLLGRVMTHAGFLLDLSQLESDNPEVTAENKKNVQAGLRSGQCRTVWLGIIICQ